MKAAIRRGVVSVVWFVAVVAASTSAAAPGDKPGTMSELERYVRIQIEIGAAMKDFFANMGPGAMNPPAQDREAMVADIDQTVATILSKYDLTTDEYNARKKEVFADEAAVSAFLDRHPDLKAQWQALPFRGGGGHGRMAPGGR